MGTPTLSLRLSRWLYRHPKLLSTTLVTLNRLRRLKATRRRRWLVGIALALGTTLVWTIVSDAATALAIAWALSHRAIAVATAGVYTASIVPKRRRAAAAARARSWLVATPRAPSTRGVHIFVSVWASLGQRWLAGAVLTLLASLNSRVTFDQSLMLLVLLTAGGTAGATIGGLLARRGGRRWREDSRYVRRPNVPVVTQPSAAGFSRWPIAQALAWARPEKARLLLAAAILSVPGGTGPLAAIALLASWVMVSYLGALLLAVPCVGRAASDWLRSTPITFWAFAWPLARRMLLHQLIGTLIGVAGALLLGVAPSTAIYAGTVWISLVALIAAVSLADCYRARSPAAKATVSMLAVLLVEQRAHGWGISLAILLTALHLRGGTRHARA